MMDARPGLFGPGHARVAVQRCFVNCQRRGNYNGWNSGAGRDVEDTGRGHCRAGRDRRGRVFRSLAETRLARQRSKVESWLCPPPRREGARRGVSFRESSNRLLEHRVVGMGRAITVTVLQRPRYRVGGSVFFPERRVLADRAGCPGSRSASGMSEGAAVADRVVSPFGNFH